MKFTYLQAPLNRYTFKIDKIRNWVEVNVEGKVLNLFAGMTELTCDEIRNDLDVTMNAQYHKDALDFIKEWEGEKFGTILLDPPYSYRKSVTTLTDKSVSFSVTPKKSEPRPKAPSELFEECLKMHYNHG